MQKNKSVFLIGFGDEKMETKYFLVKIKELEQILKQAKKQVSKDNVFPVVKIFTRTNQMLKKEKNYAYTRPLQTLEGKFLLEVF